MLRAIARTCPPGQKLTECRGLPGYSQSCSPVPVAPRHVNGGFTGCYEWASALTQPSWWTLPHIGALAALAVVVAVVVGLCAALSRDNFRASRAARR